MSIFDWLKRQREPAIQRERQRRRQVYDSLRHLTVVADRPNAEYLGGLYRSDHLQIIRGVHPEHLGALLDMGGVTMAPRAIVIHRFPEGTCSIHCFGCGAHVECPETTRPDHWLARGLRDDFVFEHRDHVDWIFNRNCPARPEDVLIPELVELPPPVPAERPLPERSPMAEGWSYVHSGASGQS